MDKCINAFIGLKRDLNLLVNLRAGKANIEPQ